MNQANIYSKFNNIAASLDAYVLEKYLSTIKFKNEDVSIADFGSGDGYVTLNVLVPRIPKKCREVIGFDVSEQMVQRASGSNNLTAVKFVKMDIGNDGLRNEYHGRFDHAFSFLCMHWIPNKRLLYRNIFNALKPDGDFFGYYVEKCPMFNAYVKMSKKPQWSPYFPTDLIHSFENSDNGEQRALETMKNAGFKNYFCQQEYKMVSWGNFEDFKEFLRSVDPIILKLEESDRDEYMNEYMAELLKEDDCQLEIDGDNEDKLFTKYLNVYVYASKV